MRSIIEKGVITKAHVWFADGIAQNDSDISFFYEMPNELSANKWIISRAFLTLLSDLSASTDELWQNLRKNTRYEIRRAEKEGVEVKYFTSSAITKELLNEYEKTYNKMYAEKGIKSVLDRNLTEIYIKNEMMTISVAYYKGEPLVFHSYIYDELNTRFYTSCSLFRAESDISAMIGRTNRYLHWKDFLFFKEVGVRYYDWGGINSVEDPSNITQFKMSFGGEPCQRHNYMKANNIKGKVFFLIFKDKFN